MKSIRVVIVFLTLFFVTGNVLAATAQNGAQPYIGGKLGLMMPDGSGLDDALNIGVVLGMKLNEVEVGSIAVEGELTTTIVDGDIRGGGDWNVTTLAGYGVYRSNGQFFFKGKLGLVYWDADVDGVGGGGADDIDLSFGIGGGYKISEKASLELEYTILESDLDFLSLGFIVNF